MTKRNEREKQGNILKTFSLIIMTSKIFGLIPFDVGKTLTANKLLSKLNSIVILFIYSSMILIFIIDWGDQDVLVGQTTNLASYIRKIKTVVGLFIMLALVGCTPFRKTNFMTLTSMAQEIDEELKIMNINLDYIEAQIKIKRCYYAFLATGIIFIGVDLAMRNICQISNIGEWAHALTVITQMVCETQVISLAWLLTDRFQILNDYLNNFHVNKRSTKDIYWVTPVGAKSTRLSVVSRVHDKLCSLCRKVEKTFASQIVLITAQSFVAVTLKMYNLFSNIIRSDYFSIHCFVPFATVSIVFDLLHVFLIVLFTSAAAKKVKISYIVYVLAQYNAQ